MAYINTPFFLELMIGIAVIFLAGIIVLFKPPKALLDEKGQILHERLKVGLMIIGGGLAGLWTFYSFQIHGYRLAELEFERKSREELPSIQTEIAIEDQNFGNQHYLFITVLIKNIGQTSARFKTDTTELLTIAKVDTTKLRFSADSTEDSPAHYTHFFHPPFIRLFNDEPSSFKLMTVEPNSTNTCCFMQKVPGPGLYYIQFKAQVDPEDDRVKKLRDSIGEPERPVFWAISKYFIVKEKDSFFIELPKDL